MKILFCSHAFTPSVGGVVTVATLLIPEFLHRGHEVVVVTNTAGSSPEDHAWNVARRPAASRLQRLVKWSDVVFHNHICLQLAWPLLLVRRPWVVAHHIWIPAPGVGRVKRMALRHATGISVSGAIARHIDTPSTIIANPYRDDVFVDHGDARRTLDLVFVGRLIHDKGVHVLLEALSRLRRTGVTPSLTVIGEGPEDGRLKEQAATLGIAEQTTFAGTVTGEDLAALLNRHRVMVVPSVWEEPFGIVALEGMACGCAVLVSDCDGLKEAIGEAGVTFRRNDPDDLAVALAALLGAGEQRKSLRAIASRHLERHSPGRIADEYLQVMAGARKVAADA